MELAALGEFIAFIAGTGFFVAVFNQGIQSYRDWRSRRRSAEIFALKSAALLERFAHQSLDKAAGIDSQLAMGRNPTDITCGLAELEDFEEEIDGWRGIRKEESATLINLRLKLEDDARTLSANAWHEGPEEATYMYRDQNVLSAADAWHLAKMMRTNYGLPQHGKIDARNPEDATTYYLEHEINAIHAREEEAIATRMKALEALTSDQSETG